MRRWFKGLAGSRIISLSEKSNVVQVKYTNPPFSPHGPERHVLATARAGKYASDPV